VRDRAGKNEFDYTKKRPAFKHNVTEDAIKHCLLNAIAGIIIEEEPEKMLFAGFDHTGNPLEIIGVVQDDTLIVIHAMKLRKQYYYLLGEIKND
jgi:hypothetical protein